MFKPRRTNSHYLQFISAITFYKQFQRQKYYDEQTGEEFIEIREANELITEVLLRKSDSITGACRNYLEELKKYLTAEERTSFTAMEVRRKLKVKKTTQWRYHQQLLDNYYLKKVKSKAGNKNTYEIINPDEYKELEATITKALQECLLKIDLTENRSAVPKRSTGKVERLTQTKTTS